MQGKDRLVAIQALPPDAENPVVQLQGELRGIGVEPRLAAAQPDAAGQFGQHAGVDGFGIVQQRLKLCIFPAVAVDRSVVAGFFNAFLIIGRGQQGVDVKGGNALQRQHHGLTGDKAVELVCILAVKGAFHRLEPGDVQFIGRLGAVGHGAHRHAATEITHLADDLIHLFLGQDALGGAHADAVV